MPDAPPETIDGSHGLTPGKYRFFNYRYPFNYRMESFDHLCVIDGKPSLPEFEDVTYSSPCLPSKGLKGTLFDADGQRIAHAISTVGPQHVPQTEEPANRAPLSGPADGLSYLYLGRFEPHFGHFITQTVSRFWALNEVDRSKYRLLAHMPNPDMLDWPYVEAILPIFGIGKGDIEFFSDERKIGSVLVAQPSMALESYIHASMRELFAPFVAPIAGKQEQTDQPVFLSRSRLRKGIYLYEGEEQLEEMLRAKGALVVHPETLPFEEQVKLFNRHRAIIGIIGSAMHNVMFSQTMPSLHYLTPRSITQTCLLLDEVFASSAEYARVTGLSDDLAAIPKKIRRLLPAVRSRPAGTFIFKRRLDIALCEKWLKTSEAFS